MPEQNEGQQAATQQQERRSRRVTLWAMANGNCQQHTQTQEDQPSRSNKNKNALPPARVPYTKTSSSGETKLTNAFL